MAARAKDYTIDEISEILVSLTDGRQFIYRDKGILNLKKTLNVPSRQRNNIVVINTVDPEEEYEEEEEETPPPPKNKNQKTSDRPQTSNGYNLIPLNYSAVKGGKSSMDIAKDLQRQAEAATGVKY